LALTIVTHPDLSRWGETAMLSAGCVLTRTTPQFIAPGGTEGRGVENPHVSRRPVIEIRGDAEKAEIRYLHDDAYVHVNGHRVGGTMILNADQLLNGVLLEIEGYVGLMLHTRFAPPKVLSEFGMVGISPPIEALRERLSTVANLDLTVLLRGETGTGKELAAQAIHTVSDRRNERMLAVNLGALESSVIASELFGHVRGAFTGAADARRGFFRDCDHGTLFLDEVGEAPNEVQRSLLRVLETGEVVPVGADRPVKTDVRVIAATDADLEASIKERDFRAPLFHRLAEYEVRLPTLRERRLDIPLIFRHFLREHARLAGLDSRIEGSEPWIPTKTMRRLLDHDWPGNARELRNVVGTALLNTPEGSDIALGARFERTLDLKSARLDSSSTGVAIPIAIPVVPTRRDLSEISDEELLQALQDNDWRPEPAAAQLGIAKTSIYQLIRANGTIPQSAKLTETEVRDALAASDHVSDAAATLRVPKRGLLHRMKKLGLS
jgi:two-component system nitrogen regulation response regulator GlnG